MNIEFTELIILLLPGFFGLWIYKRITEEDLDKRSEVTQLALALLFGIAALSLLYLIFGTKALTRLEIPSGGGLRNVGLYFYGTYMTLCVFACVVGFSVGMLQAERLTLTSLFGNLAARILGRYERSNIESALRALVNSNFEGSRPIVRVYRLGESDKYIAGFFDGYSESEKEIRLDGTDLFHDPKDFPLNQPRRCWINHQSGVVVEFVAREAEYHSAREGILIDRYNKRVSLAPVAADSAEDHRVS